MAFELIAKITNLGRSVNNAGYTLMDGTRKILQEGFTEIDADGYVLIPITSQWVTSNEYLRLVIDDFTGDNYEETGTAVDWIRVSEVYVDYSVVQSGYSVKCTNRTGSEFPWDMGDGTVVDSLNPTYVYKTNGTFTITCDDFSQEVTITTVNIFSVVVDGNTISCSPQSGVNDTWFFGDGNTSDEVSPTHTYYENGEYTVTNGEYSAVITIDYYTDGIVDSIVSNKVVLVRPDGETGDWSYGDGTTGQSDEHEYSQYGRYIIKIGDLVNAVTLSNKERPVCSFIVSPDEVEENRVTLSASGGKTYRWLVDGVTYNTSVVVHVFDVAGLYEIACTALNEDGVGDTVVRNVQVFTSNTAPTGELTYTKDMLEVTFSANAFDVDGDAVTYAWSFGDGTTSTEASPIHTYPEPAVKSDPEGQEFVVTCTIEDARGLSVVLEETIRVYDDFIYGENILVNSEFNDGVLGIWDPYAVDLTYMTDEGRDVLHVINNASNNTGTNALLRQQLSLEVGKKYKLKGTTKTLYNSGSPCSVSVRDNNTYTGALFATEYGVYQELESTFTALTVNPVLWVQARRYGEGEIYVDRIEIREQLS
jgi:PKD repeat protein